MRRSLFIYVMALGVAAAAFPADLSAGSDNVTRFAAGAAAPGNLGFRSSATRATAELIQSRYTGLEYRLTDDFSVGVVLRAEGIDRTGAFDTRASDRNGVRGVGYATFAIGKYLNLDASLGYTGIDRIDTHRATAPGVPVIGSTDEPRLFSAANLNGAYRIDRWGVSGNIGYVRAKSRLGVFGERIATALPGGITDFVQVRVGGRLAYNLPNILPFVRAFFVWDKDFSRVVVGFRDSVPPEGIDFVVGGGVSFRFSERISGGVGATTTVGRADFTNTTLSGIIRFAF